MDFLGIIPAAGSGTRLGLGYNKVFYELGGRTILEHTLSVVLGTPGCRGVVVVAAAPDMDRCRSIIGSSGMCSVTEGGPTRQDSVSNGLDALHRMLPADSGDPLVLVHDAARPFVEPDAILRVLADAESFGAAILGVPSKDTVKLSNGEGFVEGTLDRARVWNIQTPQVFRMSLLGMALRKAGEDGLSHTDEASAVEALGVPVRITMGSYSNIKVTTADDILAAQGLTGRVLK